MLKYGKLAGKMDVYLLKSFSTGLEKLCKKNDLLILSYIIYALWLPYQRINRIFRLCKACKIILNGGIIDIWQFRKTYFPNYHFKVIQKLASPPALINLFWYQ